MFTTNKRLKELDVKLDEIKKEKAELLKIKEILEDTTPKIDISNGYVLEKGKIYYLVYKQVKKIMVLIVLEYHLMAMNQH